MFQMKFNVALDSKNLTATSGKSFVDRKNMEVLFLDNAQHYKVNIFFSTIISSLTLKLRAISPEE